MGWQDPRTVLITHAHPDDETLATGALIAHWVQSGVSVHVLTATRGEQGEVVPGPLSSLAGTAALDQHRIGELNGALAELGVRSHAILGDPPARADGLPPRRYRDSGMRWVTPTVAGPADLDDPMAFAVAELGDAVADVQAWVSLVQPDLLVSYDAHGGYGHPDHIRMHEVTREVAQQTGLPMAELVQDTTGPHEHWFDLDHHLDTVVAALHHHATQVTVRGREVVHSGGQVEAIRTSVGLRLTLADETLRTADETVRPVLDVAGHRR